MKHFPKAALLLFLFSFSSMAIHANNRYRGESPIFSYSTDEQAIITFVNKSEYTMTLKIMKPLDGLYTTVYLSPRGSNSVYFSSSNSYKLKIKAVYRGSTSYHDAGSLSVTCTERERTVGTMSFSLSSYGSGLGPSISAKEFERNY